MSDSSTSNRAAQVLRRVSPRLPADAALREELAANGRLTPRDRREIARAVFAFFRWSNWLDERESLQRQVEEAWRLQERFSRDPAAVKSEALAARAVPAWALEAIDFPSPAARDAWLRQLQREPTLWIRARSGKAEEVRRTLGECERSEADETALRYRGGQDLFRTAEFRAGLFEIQDLASQRVGHACAPRPGETWWDACAGEGGKLLHLADLMQNRGLIWASDRSRRRLRTLKERAARSQVFNYRVAEWEGGAALPTKTKFDGVLVDAPCSGVGTWQRNPHARGTTTPDDVRELAAVQRSLLEHVAPSVKPGGKLVYAVCTLPRAETTDVAAAFSAAHPEFEGFTPELFPSASADQKSGVFLWPQEIDANGMYVAAWRRRA